MSLAQPGVAPAFVLLSVGNPGTTAGCDVMHITGTQDPAQAMNVVAGALAQMGIMIRVDRASAPGTTGVVMFDGASTSVAGGVRWICLGKPVPGGVVLVSAGCHPDAWAAQSALVQAILTSVSFK
jgi:hypothetical protein